MDEINQLTNDRYDHFQPNTLVKLKQQKTVHHFVAKIPR